MGETQTAYAKSAYSDPQNIALAVSVILMCLAEPSVVQIIPLKYTPMIAALSGILGIVLRVMNGTHPVANILPTQIKPVEVKKLEATKQGTEDAINLPTVMPSGEVPKDR